MRFSAVHCFSTDCTVALNLLIAMSWDRANSIDDDRTSTTKTLLSSWNGMHGDRVEA